MKRVFYVAIYLFMASCSSTPKEKDVKASNVEVTDNVTEPISEPTTTPTLSDDEKTVSNTNTTDWDVAIDEYEKYMDDYIIYLKKGKAGDATAMVDAVELMSKAESVSKRLSNAKSQLTTKQIEKFTKIQKKIINAL